MTERICLICHRKSADKPYVKNAVKAVRKQGIDLRVVVPFNKAEKPRVVSEAVGRGATRIIAGGGDGTINAVANALIDDGSTKPPAELGIFPLGTANDFARGLGLPTGDLNECLRIACTRDSRPVDVGRMNKRFFINVASAGFGAEITATTPTQFKKALGGVAYTLMGLIKALDMTPYTGRLLIPGKEPISGSILFLAVGNNRFAGGGFDVAPKAKLDDGLLDVVKIGLEPGEPLVNLRQELNDPMNPDNKHVQYLQLSEFTIESDRKMHCNLDGEPVLRKKYRFSVLPQHLRVVY